MKTGDRVPLDRIHADQHFTEPPPRFSEAALVKALEEYGIGRPSTYASIIQTLLFRKYVEMESRSFRPTDVGRAVSKFLSQPLHAATSTTTSPPSSRTSSTRSSRGEEEWVPLMEKFWGPFKELVDDKTESVDRCEATGARELGTDPKTGKPVSVRLGRYGPYAQIGTRRGRGEADVRLAAPRPEHAHDHAGRRAGAVQAAAQARRRARTRKSASASAASARSPSAAACTPR